MRDIRETLQWYVQMGVDEVIGEEVIDRSVPTEPFQLPKLAVAKKQPLSAVPESFSLAATSKRPQQAAPPSLDNTKQAPKKEIPSAAPIMMPSEALALTQKVAEDASTLEELYAAIRSFKGLSICRAATNPVVGEGAEKPVVMIIGEAPGAEEDLQGRPFCGASGHMLDNMIGCINLSRETNTYITNSINWRPPGNRRPTPEEIACCKPFVEKHIALVNPSLIILVGGTAVTAVLDAKQAKAGISSLRGEIYDYQNDYMDHSIPTTAIFHPSYLLRSPGKKQMAWRDLLQIEEGLVARGLMEAV